MFNRFLAFLAKKEVQSILCMAVVAACVLLGFSPEKQQAAVHLVICASFLAGCWLLGSSYVKGKTVEGTVPPGSESAQKIVIHVGNGAQEVTPLEGISSAELKTAEPHPVFAELVSLLKKGGLPINIPDSITPEIPPPDPTAVKGGAGTAAPGLLLAGILTGLAAMLLLGGCVATSKPFKEGANAGGQILALRASRYVNADNAIDIPGRMERLAQAEQLKRITADKNSINVADVEAAWKAVKEWYIAYVIADKTLEFDGRELRLETAVTMGALITEERKRPWWITGIPPPAVGQ